MKARRILLWVLPFLLGGLLVFFAEIPKFFKNQEQAFQSLRQVGWTTFPLKDYQNFEVGTGPETQRLISDARGRIWVAGGNEGLSGLHVIDGTTLTSQDGSYWDLAIDPRGPVWAVAIGGYQVDVYDGQQRQTYTLEDLGLKDEPVQELEVDTRGRIWALLEKYGSYRVVSYTLEQENGKSGFSLVSSQPFTGYTHSLVADKQGRVWVSIYGVGLEVFDGDTWQQVPNPNERLHDIVAIAFDNQGHTWIATNCGSIMAYDGQTWTVAVDGESSPGCDQYSVDLLGITVDNAGRVWSWNYDKVQLLHGSTWIVFTPGNSGFPGGSVFGLAVDNLDRVWIGTSNGVSMIPFDLAQPIPVTKVTGYSELTTAEKWVSGSTWFLPSVIAILWLALFFNILPRVILPLILGMFSLIPLGPPVIQIGSAYTPFINPGVSGTYLGLLGGILGGVIDTRRKSGQSPGGWSAGLAVAGWVVGYFLCYLLIVFLSTD